MTACSSFSKLVSADDSSSGKQIDIAVGGTLTVTLNSNLTTGYSWELIETGDTRVLQKTDNKYVAPTGNLQGASGKEIWNFKAIKAGKTSFRMVYAQPWSAQEAKSFTLTVVAK